MGPWPWLLHARPWVAACLLWSSLRVAVEHAQASHQGYDCWLAVVCFEFRSRQRQRQAERCFCLSGNTSVCAFTSWQLLLPSARVAAAVSATTSHTHTRYSSTAHDNLQIADHSIHSTQRSIIYESQCLPSHHAIIATPATSATPTTQQPTSTTGYIPPRLFEPCILPRTTCPFGVVHARPGTR